MAEIDVKVDDMANSVVHRPSGQVFPTAILLWRDLPDTSKASVAAWRFDWAKEIRRTDSDVVGLLAQGYETIRGLMALEARGDHVFVVLIESAPHNIGENQLFMGVAGNLSAYACGRSFALGFDGYIAFDAKNELIEHFKTSLAAHRVGSSNRMIVDTTSARRLIAQYQKEEDQWRL